MKIFKNICTGTGLLAFVLGFVFLILWLLWSIGKTGVIALSFSVVTLLNYLK